MNLTAKQFDAGNARECAVWAACAYSSFKSGCEILVDAATDTQVLVSHRPDHVIVSFRGSTSLQDWITDAKFFRDLLVEEANGDRCEVHAGFLKAYKGIIDQLSKALGGNSVFNYQPVKPLVVIGHSLGGALAILAALELKRQGFDIAQVYTFGQPRVGNAAFADLYNWSLQDKTFCVVCEGDPVPLLPTLLMGYRDCGQEVFIRRDDVIQIDPFIGLELFRDLMGAIKSWRRGSLGLLPNHNISHYQERIQEIV